MTSASPSVVESAEPWLERIRTAYSRIENSVRRTPIDVSGYLSRRTDAEVTLKLENLQHTGSFKYRGALNRVLATPEFERRRGFVAASTGNHGLAVARACRETCAEATLFVPATAAASKVSMLQATGITVEVAGEDCTDAEAAARSHAAAQGAIYLSPYNDPEVIAGQGTVGLEISEQMNPPDVVLVALGGGGLISGIAACLKALWPTTRIVACSPSNSCVMVRSLEAGEILDLPSKPTLSDGTAGGVEAGSITLPLCQELIDDCVLVEEQAIRDSMIEFMSEHHMMIEGSAAVPLAAIAQLGQQLQGQRVAAVLCGANIGLDTLSEVLAQR